MNLRDLRYLVALADCGHFGRAADACHVSQPTLSVQLKKLEEELGVVLFERTNKSVNLTGLGAQIVDRARRVLAEADGIVDLAKRQAGPLDGPFHLGIIPTLGPYLLPWLIPVLKREYAECVPVIREDLTDNLMASLRNHHLDAALLALPVGGPRLATTPLFDEPFVFACNIEHRLSARKRLGSHDLGDESLLLLADGHCLRDQALAVCGLQDPKPEGPGADVRATGLETLRQMVGAGLGSTLLPALAVIDGADADTRLIPMDKTAHRRIGLIWRASSPKAEGMTLLADVVRRCVPQVVAPVAA